MLCLDLLFVCLSGSLQNNNGSQHLALRTPISFHFTLHKLYMGRDRKLRVELAKKYWIPKKKTVKDKPTATHFRRRALLLLILYCTVLSLSLTRKYIINNINDRSAVVYFHEALSLYKMLGGGLFFVSDILEILYSYSYCTLYLTSTTTGIFFLEHRK